MQKLLELLSTRKKQSGYTKAELQVLSLRHVCFLHSPKHGCGEHATSYDANVLKARLATIWLQQQMSCVYTWQQQ